MRLLLLVFALVLVGATSADAASVRIEIYKDCEDGELQGSYSLEDIREARKTMPTDVAEYTDCVDVLRRAELAGSSGTTTPPSTPPGATTPSSGGAVPPVATPALVPETDAERAALGKAAAADAQPVTIGGENVLAGVTPLGGGANTLPGAVVVALILLALAGLALCLPSLRRHLSPLLRRR